MKTQKIEPQSTLNKCVWQLGVLKSFLADVHQILKISSASNSNFKWIWLPRVLWILIQIVLWIWRSCNKENCSLFNSIQMNILFEFFSTRRPSLIISNLIGFENIWINQKGHCGRWAGPRSMPLSFLRTPRRVTSMPYRAAVATSLPPCCAAVDRCLTFTTTSLVESGRETGWKPADRSVGVLEM
jgi:hypothetical protein